jgi:phenylacetate-coenzyme A ligase PaaK-like adenylate-forming protein
MPRSIADALARTRVCFVHSGGWKKLENLAVDRTAFDSTLLAAVAPGSLVLDCYGLVEQVGVLFPLCDHGMRHAPRWAEVIARDPWTLAPLPGGETGMLELLNVLPRGGPYHAVLTEDLGRVHPGDCACGRSGRHFELLGRVPRAEVRGCANV